MRWELLKADKRDYITVTIEIVLSLSERIIMSNPLILEAIEGFAIEGKLLSYEKYGSGHINDTFLVCYDMNGLGRLRFIFQRMSKALTKESEWLMENIERIINHLRQKISDNNGDVYRETLNIVYAPDGKPFFVDSSDEYWRVYQFIEGATTYDKVRTPDDFYESAVSYGNFQKLLSDFDANLLYETIPGFHNTKKRYEKFMKALEADVKGRAASVKEEIDFVISNKELSNTLLDLLEAGQLPLRVTHNDTKLNNIMLDDKTQKAICVIDLDTVMPGLSAYDFGDSIRFGANTADEDETDLSKVSLDVDLYNTFKKGFLEGCGGALTDKEIEMLPMGAAVMTYECGMRFLTDYLEGDVYFHIAREEHNLDRARTQFELVKDMKRKWDLIK